jgi:hypothetical protein
VPGFDRSDAPWRPRQASGSVISTATAFPSCEPRWPRIWTARAAPPSTPTTSSSRTASARESRSSRRRSERTEPDGSRSRTPPWTTRRTSFVPQDSS